MRDELPSTGERLLTSEQGSVMLEHLHRYALVKSLCQGKRVLDIACGEGYGASLLAGAAAHVVGVDISAEAIEHATTKYKKDNLVFIQGSADSIPLNAGTVDIVSSFETLEHHDRHVEMISEIKRVLGSSGLLIISTPDKLNFTDLPKTDNPFHVKELYCEEFRSLLQSHFQNVEMMYQKVVYCSAIVPERHASGFTAYDGDYSRIGSSDKLELQLYNICFASDADLPATGVSIFDGSNKLAEHIAGRERLYTTSVAYRLGRTLTWPVRKLMRV